MRDINFLPRKIIFGLQVISLSENSLLLTNFIPLPETFCKCLNHYALNPYLGCEFKCLYCYAHAGEQSLVIKDNLSEFEKQVIELPIKIIELSTDTDPYQYVEKKHEITRRALELLIERPFPIVINTKSTLITRDLDIFKKLIANRNKDWISVGISINKISNNILDICAPPPLERIETLKNLLGEGINAYLRYDPIIPFYNDDEDSIMEIMDLLIGSMLHSITISTFKPSSTESLQAVDETLGLNHRLENLYKQGKKIGRSTYLPESIRSPIIQRFNRIASKYGYQVSSCREGIKCSNVNLCDNIDYTLEYS